MKWQEWLEHLESLPPESPERDGIDRFLGAARETAERKQDELSSYSDGLKAAFKRLREEVADLLLFFDFGETTKRDESWPAASGWPVCQQGSRRRKV